MRRYRFALDPVVRVRRIEEDISRAELLAAVAWCAGAEGELDASVERYRALPEPAGPEGAAAWLARRAGAERSAATVAAAGTRHEMARTRVADGRRSLTEARMRSSALERLDERRRSDHALEVRRSEDADVDELVTTRRGVGR